jgi:parvulin-like peptidyl-prolyl isomerase
MVMAALGLWSALTNLVHGQTVLLAQGGVIITLEEAFAYSLRHTNPLAYEASLVKPLATYRVLENLYVLKRVVSLSEEESLLSVGEKEYLREDLYRRAILEKYLDGAISKRMAQVDWAGLAESEYARRKSEFKSVEQVRVEHILISIEDKPFDAFVSNVREVQAGLTDSDDFASLIVQYSDDPSLAQNGGDLGFLSRQRMQPTFSDAAFGLIHPGEIVGPVMTQSGAHFIRLVDRQAEEQLSFEKVKSALIKDIKTKTRSSLREELLNEIRNEIKPYLAGIDQAALVQSLLQKYDQLPASER